MKSMKRENTFLIIWITCILLLVGACNLGFIRATRAGFGPNNMTGQLTVPYTIVYLSNFPSELNLLEEKISANVSGKTYTIKSNEFVAEGYEFVNWNTSIDGTGDVYTANESIELNKNLTLYAQWKREEVVVISYGDVNTNGQIDEDDYLLIENYVSGVSELTGQSLLNADVNLDGNVDLVDSDIIKQAYLGTEGYVDSLPSKPILIYEIYIGDASSDNENEEDDADVNDKVPEDGENSSGNDSLDDSTDSGGSAGSDGSGSGSGTGASGSGDGSSGAGSSGNISSGGGTGSNSSGSNKSNSGSGSKPSSGNSSSSSGSNQSSSSSKEENSDNVIDNKDEEENKDDILTEGESKEDVSDTDNKIDDDQLDEEKVSYVGIIVFVICLLSLRLIVYVVRKFREKEDSNKSE